MAEIKQLFLFVHFVMPGDAPQADAYMAKWRELVNREGPDRGSALCMLSAAPGRETGGIAELHALAAERFGNRCVFDPRDESDKTKVLLAEDLLKTMRFRGRIAEWTPYEIWTSSLARKWAEGLKIEFIKRGLAYDPETLRVAACGQQWAACLAKYSMLISKYLGAAQAAEILVDLFPGAGWPVSNARFVERVPMERHVSLFLFETNDGRPVGQFLDGLRAVWEKPHTAEVKISPAAVELRCDAPNSGQEARPSAGAGMKPDGFIADVGDGCQPRLTTAIGKRGTMREFRAALAAARIRQGQ